jgi:hypothetical protein
VLLNPFHDVMAEEADDRQIHARIHQPE